jgi:hypothetical protein
MTAFEFVCYALAVLTVLWLRAEPQVTTPIAVAPAVLVDDLPTLPALPAEVLTARPVPAAAAEMAAPVAIVRVEVPTPDWAKMSNAELRRECARKNIAWRNAHGKGKHLLKGEMIKALC